MRRSMTYVCQVPASSQDNRAPRDTPRAEALKRPWLTEAGACFASMDRIDQTARLNSTAMAITKVTNTLSDRLNSHIMNGPGVSSSAAHRGNEEALSSSRSALDKAGMGIVVVFMRTSRFSFFSSERFGLPMAKGLN